MSEREQVANELEEWANGDMVFSEDIPLLHHAARLLRAQPASGEREHDEALDHLIRVLEGPTEKLGMPHMDEIASCPRCQLAKRLRAVGTPATVQPQPREVHK